MFLFLIVLFVVYFLIQARERQKDMLILSLPYFPLTYIAALIASCFYHNPRPFMIDAVHAVINHAPGNGFPSNHMLLCAAIASLLFLYNKSLGITAWAIAILVGMSRVAAGVHHSIDIVGSALISIAVLIAVKLIIYPWIIKKINLMPVLAIFTNSSKKTKLLVNNKVLSVFFKKSIH